MVRGYFLGASPDALICSAKTPGDAELWFVHLAARPQLNLFSIGRKRFAHLSDNQDEIRVDENVPWGEDTLFTLEFREEANKYAIHACNNMYLQKDGKLVPSVTKVVNSKMSFETTFDTYLPKNIIRKFVKLCLSYTVLKSLCKTPF